MKRKGFTLIELMIVVAIIGILAAIAIPNMVYTKKKAQLSSCKANLKSVATALDMYANDNQDIYPTAGASVAADGGVLMTNGYTKAGVHCPCSPTAEYTYDYDSGTGVYTLTCPDATKHFWNPTQTLTSLYFQAEVGIVTDPAGK